MDQLPTVTAIVLNWNGRSYLPSCLQALLNQEYPPFDIILVDNASSDDSIPFVQATFPQVTIIQNPDNLGFAAGNNVALRQLQTELAVLVNPDVILAPDALRHLAHLMQTEPNIGLVGIKLHYPGGQLIQHAGGYLTPPQAMPGHFGIREQDTGQHNVQRDVAYVIGAAMGIRREVLTAVNLFDEGFFLYYEDVDLCTRVWQTGYRVVYTPLATGIHVESALTRPQSLSYFQRFHTGRWRYLLKHQPVNSLHSETLPAEQQWLDQLGKPHRTIMLLVYHTLRGQVAAIAHERHESQPRLFYQLLDTLTHHALRQQEHDPLSPQIEAHAVVEERPFTSNTPLLGPLIVRFRELWNSVAAKWHVRSILQQQNSFNQLVAQQLREQQAWLQSQHHWLNASDPSQLLTEIAQLRQQVANLQARLEEQEKKPSLNRHE